MPDIRKRLLDELFIENHVTSGTNNNYFIFSSLPYCRTHNPAIINGDITFSGITCVEVLNSLIDSQIAKPTDFQFCIDSENKIKLAYSKAGYANKQLALDALQNAVITYTQGSLTSTDNNWYLVEIDCNGNKEMVSTPIDWTQAGVIANGNVSKLDVNRSGVKEYRLIKYYSNV